MYTVVPSKLQAATCWMLAAAPVPHSPGLNPCKPPAALSPTHLSSSFVRMYLPSHARPPREVGVLWVQNNRTREVTYFDYDSSTMSDLLESKAG